MQAVKEEGSALVSEQTWLEDTVMEFDDLKSQNQGKDKIHIGELLSLCSIKNHEMHPSFHKWKGRVVFQSNNVRDEEGLNALFAERGSSSCMSSQTKDIHVNK